ncbi:transcription factor Myb2 [Haematococcus lacustris]
MSGNRAIQKTKWNAEEDSHLIRLVHELGEGNWSPIARALNVVLGTLDGGQARTGKQCRERWSHHLKPDLKKGDWNAQEEAWLVSLHQDLGNKWADIARNIEGRSENSVKNHWNAVHRRW